MGFPTFPSLFVGGQLMAQDQKSICKDLKPCRLVLDRTVDSCRTAFQEYIAEKAGFFLGDIWGSWAKVTVCHFTWAEMEFWYDL